MKYKKKIFYAFYFYVLYVIFWIHMTETDTITEKPFMFKKSNNQKILIFEFSSNSNGWADRLKGIYTF